MQRLRKHAAVRSFSKLSHTHVTTVTWLA